MTDLKPDHLKRLSEERLEDLRMECCFGIAVEVFRELDRARRAEEEAEQFWVTYQSDVRDLRAQLAAAKAEAEDMHRLCNEKIDEISQYQAQLAEAKADAASADAACKMMNEANVVLVASENDAVAQLAALAAAVDALAEDVPHTHDLAVLLRWPDGCKRCAALAAYRAAREGK
jgi:chromosome segregation ATPase